MSEYFKKAVLNILRGTSVNGITPYLALYNGDPDNSGVELSGGGYERQQLSFAAPVQQSSNECTISTNESVSTERATASWGTWAQTVIMDKATGGNVIFSKTKTPSKIMRKGLLVMVAAGDLSLAVN